MNKITLGQFLAFTNVYVPIYIEDEFQRYDCIDGYPTELSKSLLGRTQLECPIDYIRNIDGGHRNDNEKQKCGIVLGIGLENFEKYFINNK